MLGIALFGVIAYRALAGERSAERRFPRRSTIGAGTARRRFPARWRPAGRQPASSGSSPPSPGLDEMTSSSAAGSTNVTLQFDLGRNIDRRRGRRCRPRSRR